MMQIPSGNINLHGFGGPIWTTMLRLSYQFECNQGERDNQFKILLCTGRLDRS